MSIYVTLKGNARCIPKVVSQSDLLWITGFFEGEGYAGYYYYSDKSHFVVSISQKYRDILDWIRDTLGYGYVVKYDGNGFTKIPMYYWRCSGHTAKYFLEAIRPHMKSEYKTKQVDKAVKRALKKMNFNYYITPELKEDIYRYVMQNVPTAVICQHLQISRPSVYKAQKGLL